MAQRLALLYLGIASLAIVACCLFSGFVAELIFVVLVMGFPTAVIVLAVAQKGSVGLLVLPLVAFTTILEVCGVAVFLMKNQGFEGSWFGGLPLAAALQVYGLWLGPLFLVALAYGWTFDRCELPKKDLDRFYARRAAKTESSEA